MEAFTYYCPTEVVFGCGTEESIAGYVKKHGGSRVLLVYGGGSAVRSGLLDRIGNRLAAEQIPYELFGGAKANPTLEHAREGVNAAASFQADMIVAAGGGSAIDTAKAIALGAADPATDIWEYWSGKQAVTKGLPVGVVLTIPAAGSETSSSSVLTNTETGQKKGMNTDFNRPKFAILNPELTFSLPAYQVACGVTDIMMHTLDRYFNPQDNEVTDSIAEALLRTVVAKGKTAVENPGDYDSMSELMWAGSLSHNGLTGLGGINDFAVHQLGHELSARFDVAHGASLSMVWDSWARYVWKQKPARFVRYAKNVWGLDGEDETALILSGISATADYFKSIGMPTGFGQDPLVPVLSGETLNELAHRCSYGGARTIGSFRVLGEDDILSIYQAANRK